MIRVKFLCIRVIVIDMKNMRDYYDKRYKYNDHYKKRAEAKDRFASKTCRDAMEKV